MMRLVRVDDPQLSADGKLVAFTAQTVDMAGELKAGANLCGASKRRRTRCVTNEGSMNTRPRWSPDSKRLFFVSNRIAPNSPAGVSQIWSENADGTDPRPMTSLPTGADGVTVSPDGQVVLFTSDVYPSCEGPNATSGADYDFACNRTNRELDIAAKLNARTYTALLYRHWNQYAGRTRRHLLVETLNNSFRVRDLTPGNRDTPPFSLGGPDGYSFAPDSSADCLRDEHRSRSCHQYEL